LYKLIMMNLNNDMTQMRDAIKKVWKAVDTLRGSFNSNDYFIILFLLTLIREGILDEATDSFLNARIKKRIGEIDESSPKKEYLTQVSYQFEESVAKLTSFQVENLIGLLTSIDKIVFENEFGELFDFLLYELTKSQGRFGGEGALPKELAIFMSQLVNLETNSTVYNPFSGYASLITLQQGRHVFYGEEFNRKTWAIGAMRLLSTDKYLDTNYQLVDSIENWNSKRLKYDLVISSPPFNMRLNGDFEGQFGRIRTVDSFFIEKGVKAVKEGGKLVVVVSNSFLSRGGYEENLRKYLIKDDLLESVISLPSGLLYNTDIPVTVLVLSKSENRRSQTQFVDGSAFIQGDRKARTLKYDELLKIIHSDRIHGSVRFVTSEIIHENDYNLVVGRYFKEEVEGVTLGSISNIYNGASVDSSTVGLYVRNRDLSNDRIRWELDLSSLEELSLPRGSKKIEESVLLISTRWKSLKVAYFEYNGTPINIGSGIVSIKVNPDLADLNYLTGELLSDYVDNQYQAFNSGGSISLQFIKKSDLFQIKIELPSIKEQRAKVKGIATLSKEIQQLEQERNNLAHGVIVEKKGEFASLKHTLGTPRQNILSYSEALIKFFEDNDSPSLTEVKSAFKNALGEDLISVFQSVKADINYISELLEKGENGLILEDYALNSILIKDIQSQINQVKANTYNFSLEVLPIRAEDKAILRSEVVLNKSLLKSLLDNVLSNASKHGFENGLENNQVIIDLSIINDDLVIEIKNNGKPFPNNFDKDKFIAKYSTANPEKGTGLGGYDINRIATYFNGTWDLILNEDEVYPVKFSFSFPIIFIS
jgi:type I restriction enzyme M protein